MRRSQERYSVQVTASLSRRFRFATVNGESVKWAAALANHGRGTGCTCLVQAPTMYLSRSCDGTGGPGCSGVRRVHSSYTTRTRLVQYTACTANQLCVYTPCTAKPVSPNFVNCTFIKSYHFCIRYIDEIRGHGFARTRHVHPEPLCCTRRVLYALCTSRVRAVYAPHTNDTSAPVHAGAITQIFEAAGRHAMMGLLPCVCACARSHRRREESRRIVSTPQPT